MALYFKRQHMRDHKNTFNLRIYAYRVIWLWYLSACMAIVFLGVSSCSFLFLSLFLPSLIPFVILSPIISVAFIIYFPWPSYCHSFFPPTFLVNEPSSCLSLSVWLLTPSDSDWLEYVLRLWGQYYWPQCCPQSPRPLLDCSLRIPKFNFDVAVKNRGFRIYAMKAYTMNISTAARTLNCDTWKWVFSFSSRLLYSWERNTGTFWTGGCVGSGSGLTF